MDWIPYPPSPCNTHTNTPAGKMVEIRVDRCVVRSKELELVAGGARTWVWTLSGNSPALKAEGLLPLLQGSKYSRSKQINSPFPPQLLVYERYEMNVLCHRRSDWPLMSLPSAALDDVPFVVSQNLFHVQKQVNTDYYLLLFLIKKRLFVL